MGYALVALVLFQLNNLMFYIYYHRFITLFNDHQMLERFCSKLENLNQILITA